ncbi:MAG: hypothetical protein RSC84_02650 [Peptostreptococcaceae bacterium]
MAKEIRVVFNDHEMDIYDYVSSKSSKGGFLKDLASREKKRDDNYINSSCAIDSNIEKIFLKYLSQNSIELNKDECNEGHNDKSEFEFNVDDIEF